MTTVYFIRHAQSDHNNQDEQTRRLSAQGKAAVAFVTSFLADKNIAAAFSSPYQRAIDTIADFSEKHGIAIQCFDGFREWNRQKDNSMSTEEMYRRYWADFDYRFESSESLREVQHRNIDTLCEVLDTYEGKNVIIGTHGMALSTIINYYDPRFSYDDFCRLLPIMPLVVKMTFKDKRCLCTEQIAIE